MIDLNKKDEEDEKCDQFIIYFGHQLLAVTDRTIDSNLISSWQNILLKKKEIASYFKRQGILQKMIQLLWNEIKLENLHNLIPSFLQLVLLHVDEEKVSLLFVTGIFEYLATLTGNKIEIILALSLKSRLISLYDLCLLLEPPVTLVQANPVQLEEGKFNLVEFLRREIREKFIETFEWLFKSLIKISMETVQNAFKDGTKIETQIGTIPPIECFEISLYHHLKSFLVLVESIKNGLLQETSKGRDKEIENHRKENHKLLNICFKYSTQFLELVAIKHLVPLIDQVFKVAKAGTTENTEDSGLAWMMKNVKTLQLATRSLQHLCSHTKVLQSYTSTSTATTKYIPLVKRALEKLVFMMKGILESNEMLDLYWMGNLKHRDLQGQEIFSQQVP